MSTTTTARDLVDGLDAGRLRRMLRTYVQNTFIYHRQYIYDTTTTTVLLLLLLLLVLVLILLLVLGEQQYIYDVLVHQYTDWKRTVATPESRRDCLVELLADALVVVVVVVVVA